MAKVGKKPEGDSPKCACGCGESVRWLRGRGWSKYCQGHHTRVNNPNKGDHMRGDANPMRRPEVRKKVSGANHWRKRLGNEYRAEEYRQEQMRKVGDLSPNWKGGKTRGREGRPMIRVNGEYVYEHRFKMEQLLGRKLKSYEVVHHRDGNVTNNQEENLELLENQEKHVALHNREGKQPRLDPSKAPLCACGCDKKVGLSSQYKGLRYNRYIDGHFNELVKRIAKRK